MFWMFNDCLVYGSMGVRGVYVFKGIVWFKMALLHRNPTAEWYIVMFLIEMMVEADVFFFFYKKVGR